MDNNALENRNGILYFDGCNTLELAEQYGTPLYLMSESLIEEKISEIKASFTDKYSGKANCRIAYASKAFCTKAMMNICNREGLCVDVVSGGELYIAKAAGFPAERIEFNGNNKTLAEIREAIDYGVGRIIVDGLTELKLIEEVCRESGKRTKVLFRVSPGVKADTHDHLITGKKDSKFGIPFDDSIFFSLVEEAIESEYIDFMGLHIHIGSQIFDVGPYMEALEILLSKVAEIKERFGVTVKELNLGGGYGVKYTDEEPKPFDYYLGPMVERVIEFYEKELGEEPPNLVIEPGRSIVGEAGVTLYTVGQIKDVPGVRKFVSVDGGMGDNIRPSLYGAKYSGLIANKMDEPKDDLVTVSGKNCETGDLLIQGIYLPKSEAGDILAVLTTGAYCFSMSSNYNSNPVPPVVLCKNGTSRIIVKRQTYEQLIENQLD